MIVKIRNLSKSNEETEIKISKIAKIATLKNKIAKILHVKPNLQELYYGGKHLELENILYDYNINASDVIQFILKSDRYSLNNSEIDSTISRNDKCNNTKSNYESLENAESQYYVVGDSIDCVDFEYGAWFEATIKKICYVNSKLTYVIKWDLVENAQLFYATEEFIRPRTNTVIAKDDLKVGDKVMINHNLDRPADIGFWYDLEITEILFMNDRCVLTGTLYIGKNKQSLHNHRVELKEKVYAITKPKLLKDRDLDNDHCIPFVRRPIAPECYHCYDKSEANCTYCACVVCGGKNNPHLILVCDECEDEYHISCLTPPLLDIPEDDWYCAKCKTDENEIIKVGQLVKKRPLIKCDEMNSKTKKSKVNEEKKKTIVPKDHIGSIPGIEVGTCWANRVGLFNSGMHRQTIAGIHGNMNECAYSLILSGNYNDIDNGNEFIYTGSGGHGSKGALRVPIADQTLTRANKALALNCKAEFNDEVGSTATNWKEGIPVRVIRSHKLLKFSKYAPTEGNRYDGLYKVVKYYPETDQSGFRVWRFHLKRDDPVPPPWIAEDINASSELGLSVNHEIKSNQTESLKVHEENKILQDPEEVQYYHLDNSILELIHKDTTNAKLWKNCKSYLPNGKKAFFNQVFLSLQCVCCHELVSKPVTTPCAHNICQSCLAKSLSAGLKSCPTCRFNFGTANISVNKILIEILFLLFSKYH